MAAKVEELVLKSVESKGEPLTLSEIQEKMSCSSNETQAALQRLEIQGKVRSHFIAEASISVYIATLQVFDSDKSRKPQTENSSTYNTKRSRPVGRCSSKLRQPFKSPLQSKNNNIKVEERASLSNEIEKLHSKLETLNKDIQVLSKDYSEEELQLHIQKLHEYNEIKDVGQLIIGKLAEIDGTTTRAMYEEFGLDLED